MDEITVKVIIEASVENVWKLWVDPKDIIQWNNASDDWHTTNADNDLREGGSFNFRMEAKDGSMGFDFGGVYEKVITNGQIDYIIGDGRKVKILFYSTGNKTEVIETFEAESTQSIELQKSGWQAILNNFKKYAELNKP